MSSSLMNRGASATKIGKETENEELQIIESLEMAFSFKGFQLFDNIKLYCIRLTMLAM